MPRPQPLVALHGDVDFSNKIAFDSDPLAPALAANDLLVMRRATGGPNLIVTPADLAGFSAVPDPLLLGNGSAGAPTYSYVADPDTGVFRFGTDSLGFAAGGVEGIRVTEIAAAITVAIAGNTTVTGRIATNNASGPALLNEVATLTNPTLVINKAFPTTGIGGLATGVISIITLGAEAIRIDNLADIGIKGDLLNTDGGGGSAGFLKVAPTAIVPNLVPSHLDRNTGIGRAGVDQLSLIAGGVEGIRVTEVANSITADIKMGSGTGRARIVGVANVNTTAVGNVGVGVDDLITFSLPANSLSVNGKGVRITAWGTFASNGNTKQVNLDFGATTIRQIGPAGINGLDWRIDGIVIRTGAATQKAIATEIVDTTAPDSTLTTPAETLSGAVIIKCTGEGVSDNDIVQEGMLIEYLS